MIVHDKFLIGHIPRTGGDVVSYCFRHVLSRKTPVMVIDANHNKHDPLWRFGIEERDWAMTFRRLDSWLLSYLMMGIQTGTHPSFTSWPLPNHEDIFDQRSGYGERWISEPALKGPLLTLADRYICHLTQNFQQPVKHWLRMEHLLEDLTKMSCCYMEIDPEDRGYLKNGVESWVPEKVKLMYNRDVNSHWSQEQIQKLYEFNPIWATVEKRIYSPDFQGNFWNILSTASRIYSTLI